jgi:hypothetical protein
MVTGVGGEMLDRGMSDFVRGLKRGPYGSQDIQTRVIRQRLYS